MKFDLYCAGLCRDNGKLSQIAGAGIVLVNEDVDQVRRRELGFPLGSSNTYLAEIQAVRLALASIKPGMRHHPTVIHAVGQYAARLLATRDHEYVVKPSKNVEEIGELRKWYSFYPKIQVVKADKAAVEVIRARELAKVALETQEEYDSQTMG